MGRKITNKYIQTQLRYWANKLATKNSAECVILTYLSSDDSLNGSLFVNGQITNEFTVLKNKPIMQKRKCKFKYWDNYDEQEIEFDSIGEAAKYFSYSRQAISKFVKTGKIFVSSKPYWCKVQYKGE